MGKSTKGARRSGVRPGTARPFTRRTFMAEVQGMGWRHGGEELSRALKSSSRGSRGAFGARFGERLRLDTPRRAERRNVSPPRRSARAANRPDLQKEMGPSRSQGRAHSARRVARIPGVRGLRWRPSQFMA